MTTTYMAAAVLTGCVVGACVGVAGWFLLERYREAS